MPHEDGDGRGKKQMDSARELDEIGDGNVETRVSRGRLLERNRDLYGDPDEDRERLRGIERDRQRLRG